MRRSTCIRRSRRTSWAPVGGVTWTLVLEPTGKVESLAADPCGRESFDLDTDAGFGEALAARSAAVQDPCERRHHARSATSADRRRPRGRAHRSRVAPMGFEIVPGETIPAVTGVVTVAVSFTKGCYPGQELVERMDSRGADAPRSLASSRWPPAPRSAIRCSPTTAPRSARSPVCRRPVSRHRPGQARSRHRPAAPHLPDRETAWSVALGATSHAICVWGCVSRRGGAMLRRIATTSGCWRTPINSGEPSMIDASRAATFRFGGGTQPADRRGLVAEGAGGTSDRSGRQREGFRA